jgi:hypothetical protein
MVALPPIARLSEFAEMFEGGTAKSKQLSRHYRPVAEERGCELLDASEVIVSSDVDGIHLDLSEHQKLGEAVATRVSQILNA